MTVAKRIVAAALALAVSAAVVVAVFSASATSQNSDAPLLNAGDCTDGTFVDTAANPVVSGSNNDLVDDCQALVAVQNHWAAVSPVLRSWGTATTQKINTWANITVSSGRVTDLDLTRDISPNSNLTGAIPAELGNLTGLTGLSLSYNNLSGSIPAELGNLTSLTRLWLDNNSLSGEIPAELGNLTNLAALELEQNSLSGEIPAELGNLTNLTFLRLDNNRLSGEIPPEFGNLTSLTYLSLERNSLTGAIPAQLGNLTNLTRLWLSYNSLSGVIPAELGNLANLTSLSLAHNNLRGSIPAQLGSLARSQGGNLVSLDLCGNSLTGSIPLPLRSVRSSYCIRPPANNPYRPTTTTTTTTITPSRPVATSSTTTTPSGPTTSTTTITPSGPTTSTTTTTTAPPRVSVCDSDQREWPALMVEARGASISAIRTALLDTRHTQAIYRWNQSTSQWDRVAATTGTLPEGTIISLRCVTTDTDALFSLNLLGSTKQITLRRYNNIIIAPVDLTRPQGARSSYLIAEELTTCRGISSRDSGITSITIRNSATGRWSISFPCRPDRENSFIAEHGFDEVSSISQGDVIHLNFIAISPYNDNYDIYWNTQTSQYETGTGPS